ncbi:MAG TPA: twin-arginine translocase subunit TatC [Candidatus Saccharimonadales bacterium]|nr:twin-arginine translocase subunit TatC [Candidatus Saccharimonadales bacterium]
MARRKTKALDGQLETTSHIPLTFGDHLSELRSRLIIIVGSILLFSAIAYAFEQQIVNFLLRPSRGQQFIYTSPIGGVNFLFSVCLYTGIVFSLPIVIYHIVGFLKPLFNDKAGRSIWRYCLFSASLAVAGFCAGYYIGLPTALNFLSHQFVNHQVHALLTLQEYMSFLTIYLLGSALLFQLPIILLIINRAKPLKPSGLFKSERYVIVGAFIVSMIMAPTVNILDQLIIAVPIIVMYNVGVALIALNQRQAERRSQPEQSTKSATQPMPAVIEVEPTQPTTPQVIPRVIKPVLGPGGLSPYKINPKAIFYDVMPPGSPPFRRQPST